MTIGRRWRQSAEEKRTTFISSIQTWIQSSWKYRRTMNGKDEHNITSNFMKMEWNWWHRSKASRFGSDCHKCNEGNLWRKTIFIINIYSKIQFFMRLNRKWCKGNDISAYRIQCYPFFLPKVELYNDVFVPK